MSKNKFRTSMTSGSGYGVTRTVNADGSVTLSGIATGSYAYNLGYYDFENVPMILSGGVSEDVYLSVWRNNAYYESDVGDGVAVSDKTGSYQIRLRFRSGADTNGITIYPMLRDATDLDPTWAPYGTFTGIVNVSKRTMSLDTAPLFDGYSGVRITVGTDDDGDPIVFFAGNENGRVLEIQNPFGTQAMANNILNDIRGYQYQPLKATGALLNPAAEIGDGISVNGVYSGLYMRATTFGQLMEANVEAPVDEEIEHEFAVETPTDRAFSRFVASTRASITLNSNEIASEVIRATTAEQTLSSNLSQTATEIRAEVTEVDNNKLNHTRTNTSFGWTLTSSGFFINKSGNVNVFTANKDGIKIQGNAEVTGKITATSGYIGNGSSGFTINSTYFANGKSSLTDNKSGVYIGTNGIALGANSAFKVTSSGAVTATNLTITGGSINLNNGAFKVTTSGAVTASNLTVTGGSININNKFRVDSQGNLYATSGTFEGNIYAKNILYGGSAGTYPGAGITGGTVGTGQLTNYCNGGVGGGVNFNSMEGETRTANVYANNVAVIGSGLCACGHHTGGWDGVGVSVGRIPVPQYATRNEYATIPVWAGGAVIGYGELNYKSVYQSAIVGYGALRTGGSDNI